MARPNIKLILGAQALALRRVDAARDAELLDQLARVVAPDGFLSATLDNDLQITDDSASDGTTERTLALLSDLTGLFAAAAKKDVIADLGRITDFLRRHATMPISDVFKSLTRRNGNSDELAGIARRLNDSIGGDDFEPLLDSLLRNRSVRQQEWITLAELTGTKLPPSTAKKSVVEHFRRVHRGLAAQRAKNRAMEGRSAA